MAVGQSSPFGGRTRTETLIALRLLEESYAREIARLLERPLSGVQKALKSLESDGLVAGRAQGRTRLLRISPRYFAYDELRAYVARLAEAEDELRERVGRLRRRPRRAGKRL
jgi:DNA-binding transcriptional ArsR family regulator